MPLLNSKPVNFETAWADLERALLPLISDIGRGLTNDEWMHHYTAVYKICTNASNPQSEQLYFRLKAMLEKYCGRLRDQLWVVPSEGDLLIHYASAFSNYFTGMKYGGELFSYLNRYWIRTSHAENGQTPIPGVYPVTELALHVWRDVVFTKLRGRVKSGLIGLIKKARESEEETFEQSSLAYSIVDSYLKLGLNKHDPMKLYREEIEESLLKATGEFYSRRSADSLQRLTIAHYLREVEEILSADEKRFEKCLPKPTLKKLRQECERVLIEDHVERLCGDAEVYLEEGRNDDLKRLFRLLSLRDEKIGLAALKNIVKKFIESKGTAVINEYPEADAAKEPAAFMEALLKLYGQFNDLISSTFGTHPLFRQAFDLACRTFVNMRSRTPELLARYSHSLLDKSGAAGSGDTTPRHHRHAKDEAVIEAQIEGVATIFRFLDDKDFFKHFYSKFYAKRIIENTSISDDMEELMLRSLRDTCGIEYASKLNRMFNDKRLSSDLSLNFRKWVRNGGKPLEEDAANRSPRPRQGSVLEYEHELLGDVDFDVLVLTAGSWPIQTPSATAAFRTPRELEPCMESFQKFYHSKHTGSKLYWLYQQSRGDLRANCFSSKYELQVSTYQMAILLLFNDLDSILAQDICRSLGLSMEELRAHIEPILRAGVLVCRASEENASNMTGETEIVLNFSFSNKRTRLKLHTAAAPADAVKEVAVAKKEIVEDRRMVVQAAAVRIMKTKKALDHNQLVTEIINQLSRMFKPSVQQIKQNIEILIDKEYIQRVDGQVQSYVYVA